MAQDEGRDEARSKHEKWPYDARPLEQEAWALGKRRGVATDEGSRRIGELISELRKKRGITQVEMAQKLGVTQSMVSKYEKGEMRLHAELIVHLAQVLRVSTDHLLGVKETPAEVSNARGERGLWKKLRLVAQLPERDQRAVLRLINSVASNAMQRAG